LSIQSTTNQLVPSTFSSNQAGISEPNPTINKNDLTLITKTPNDFESLWDLDEINRFTREIFKHSTGNPCYLIS